MKTVFVINDSGHDLSDAERFGTLNIITKGEVQGKYHLTQLLRIFSKAMNESSSNDYVLISGPTTANVVACCMFAMRHKRINLLLFTGEKYITRELNFKHLGKEDME